MRITMIVFGVALTALSACSGGGNLGNNTTVIDVPVSEGAHRMLCGQIAQSADPVKARYGCEDG